MSAGVRDIRIKFTGDTSGLEKASKDGASSLDKFKGGATKAANIAGAAVGGALVLGLSDAIGNEQVLANFKASVGDTAWSEKAGKAAGNLYMHAYGESVADTADAVKQVFAGGLLKDDATQAQIESLTGQALSLAQVFGEEVGPLANSAGQLIKTGLAKNSEEAFDIITKGFQGGANKSEDFLDTLNEYGTQFRKFGVSGAEAVGLIEQGLEAGARDGDLVADAIKEFSIRAIDGSKNTAAGFKTLGLSAGDMAKKIGAGGASADQALDLTLDKLRAIKDPVARAAAATQLFGTQAEDLGDALFALDPSEAAKRLGDFAGAAAEVDKTVGATASGSLTAMSRQLRGELSGALTTVLPYVITLTTTIAEFKGIVVPLVLVLGTFAGIVWGINAATRAYTAATTALNTVKRILGIQTALNTTATAANATVTNVATVATERQAIAQRALNLAFLTNPLFLIIAAIIALVVIIVIVATKTDFFQKLWTKSWALIKSSFDAVFGFIRDHWPLILAILTGPIGIAVLLITKNWDRIKGGAQAAFNWVRDNWPLLLAIITGPIGLAVFAITKNWDKIKAGATGAKNWVVDKFTGLIDYVKSMPGKLASAGKGLFDWLVDAVKGPLNAVIGAIRSFGIPEFKISIPLAPDFHFGGLHPFAGIPFLAKGGNVQRAGDVIVGEAGPERLSLPRGARVTPLDQDGGGARYTVEVHGNGDTSVLESLITKVIVRKNRGDRAAALAGARRSFAT